MTQTRIFDSETVLPDEGLTARASTLLGFDTRYARIRDQLRLLLSGDELVLWNRKYHGGKLSLVQLVTEQYPLAIFYGDVGTGKTVTAECAANRLVMESRTEDAVLFKLSNRVRGSGKVGEMGTLLADAFQKVIQIVGRGRRSMLIIDEGDSLAAARSQDHSHHEDKVAVNTLIQGIDDLRRFGGRIVTILCTNRVMAIDPALRRWAAILEEFRRPSADERRELLAMDLAALKPSESQLSQLVAATGAREGQPEWTYSDIRTRLYPAALASAFPERPLQLNDLLNQALNMKPSPAIEDR
jgi:SpoVK/Ycf46/Vps4 family AAA+-type ATPase